MTEEEIKSLTIPLLKEELEIEEGSFQGISQEGWTC
jgi:hypothetical protein